MMLLKTLDMVVKNRLLNERHEEKRRGGSADEIPNAVYPPAKGKCLSEAKLRDNSLAAYHWYRLAEKVLVGAQLARSD